MLPVQLPFAPLAQPSASAESALLHKLVVDIPVGSKGKGRAVPEVQALSGAATASDSLGQFNMDGVRHGIEVVADEPVETERGKAPASAAGPSTAGPLPGISVAGPSALSTPMAQLRAHRAMLLTDLASDTESRSSNAPRATAYANTRGGHVPEAMPFADVAGRGRPPRRAAAPLPLIDARMALSSSASTEDGPDSADVLAGWTKIPRGTVSTAKLDIDQLMEADDSTSAESEYIITPEATPSENSADGALYKVPSAFDTVAAFQGLTYARFGNRMLDELNGPAMDSHPLDDSAIAIRKSWLEAYYDQSSPDEQAPRLTIASRRYCPPAEFVYSNNMFLGEDVPPPKTSKGCGCIGPCNENTNCWCMKRQELYFLGHQTGFAYQADGTIKPGSYQYPIFECGRDCECPPSCQNRVAQRGRPANVDLELVYMYKKGWGVRAKRDIPANTFVGIYTGELITEAEAERRGKVYNIVNRTWVQ